MARETTAEGIHALPHQDIPPDSGLAPTSDGTATEAEPEPRREATLKRILADLGRPQADGWEDTWEDSERAKGGGTLAGELAQWLEARAKVDRLRRRERQVLDLISRGLSNKEIAISLGLSPRTVEIHRGNMMLRLDARSAGDAVRIAIYAALADKFAPDEEPDATDQSA